MRIIRIWLVDNFVGKLWISLVDNLWISRPCGADLLAIARPHNRSRGDL